MNETLGEELPVFHPNPAGRASERNVPDAWRAAEEASRAGGASDPSLWDRWTGWSAGLAQSGVTQAAAAFPATTERLLEADRRGPLAAGLAAVEAPLDFTLELGGQVAENAGELVGAAVSHAAGGLGRGLGLSSPIVLGAAALVGLALLSR